MSVREIARAEFLKQVRDAVAGGAPYASAKLGVSDSILLSYPVAQRRELSPLQQQAYFASLRHHGLNQIGVFPIDCDFLPVYNQFYAEHLRNIDCIGVHSLYLERETLDYWEIAGSIIPFLQQEPDRSIPADEANCYLPSFAGKRILIINPAAHAFVARANKQVFESVWGKTGKKWFEPAAVLTLEFPYGVSPVTRSRHANVIELFEEAAEKITKLEFDIALISAAALGVPFASVVKSHGKIAISMGGHLLPLFGFLGKRWKEQEQWMANYITAAWTPLPQDTSLNASGVCDGGAYW